MDDLIKDLKEGLFILSLNIALERVFYSMIYLYIDKDIQVDEILWYKPGISLIWFKIGFDFFVQMLYISVTPVLL